MDAGQSGLRGLNALHLVAEECESECAGVKRTANTIETASDVKLIEKHAISTHGALQHQQPLQRRLLQPRTGQDGRYGHHVHRLVAMEKKHENELALTALILDNHATENVLNRDIAMRFPAQQRTSQQQQKNRQNGPTGRSGPLARRLAMLEHARERDTAKDHTAQVRKISNKNVAGKCVQLIRPKQRPQKIHIILQIVQSIVHGPTGQHVADHAAEAASTELENAKQDTVLALCDRINLVIGHPVQQLQQRRRRQRRRQLVITGVLGDLGENVSKLLTVDEDTANAIAWVTQTGAPENEKNQRNAQSLPRLLPQQRQQHTLLRDGENGQIGPIVRNLAREESLSAQESVSGITKTAMAKNARQRCAIVIYVPQARLRQRQKILTTRVSGQSGASGEHVRRRAAMVEQFVQENASQTVTETRTVLDQKIKRSRAWLLNHVTLQQQVQP